METYTATFDPNRAISETAAIMRTINLLTWNVLELFVICAINLHYGDEFTVTVEYQFVRPPKKEETQDETTQ